MTLKWLEGGVQRGAGGPNAVSGLLEEYLLLASSSGGTTMRSCTRMLPVVRLLR